MNPYSLPLTRAARLARWLPRGTKYRRDPGGVPGISLAGPAGMVATVGGGVLALTGGTAALAIPLAVPQTLAGVVAAVNAAGAGYAANLVARSDDATAPARGALALLDASGTGAALKLQVATITSWAVLDAIGGMFDQARGVIGTIGDQLRFDRADGFWLNDWLARLLASARLPGESDAALRRRLVATITRRKVNAFAIEDIVFDSTGIRVTLEDIDWLRDDGTTDPDVVARYQLVLNKDGRPAWGPPDNGNLIQCVFAVKFAAGATCADYQRVMPLINQVKAGGTLAWAYRPASALHANIAGELMNSLDYVVGPFTGGYIRWTC